MDQRRGYKGMHTTVLLVRAKPMYAIYKYPNTQEASPIWFHDHVLGITRLNVFAGLAGAYLIHRPGPDDFRQDSILPGF